MAFSRAEVEQAMTGFHMISWNPGQKPDACQFERLTTGKYVWVSLPNGQSARLNETASRLLMEGKYRKP